MNSAVQIGRKALIELNFVVSQELGRVFRLIDPIVAELNVGPAREHCIAVPNALAVSQQN
jgi:hypothetical protein